MKGCMQAPGLNMLQHGELVHLKYKQLIAALEAGDPEYSCIQALFDQFKLPPAEVLERYQTCHDCGKHLCLEISEDGKRRFPNHSEVSAQQFLIIYPDDGFSAALIRQDMGFHTLRGEELIKLCGSPFAPVLYFTAWAEIEANAEMFGGKGSESFKIKRSRLIQAGKKLTQRK